MAGAPPCPPARNHDPSAAATQISCRLCKETATATFTLLLLGKHHVCFYRCNGCGSLQTERPYWLDEAYSNSNLAALDTGAAQRNLNNLAAIYAWVHLTGMQTVVDVGGGDGLLCRLLRDYGVDARMEDRYATNTYAQGFDADTRLPPVLYTAFEVIEHYSDPLTDLDMLFGTQPESIVITTALYDNQGSNWWYLTPSSGQHIFFYTRRALEIIASRFGYKISFLGNYTIFSKETRLGPVKSVIAKLVMSNVGIRVVRSLMMLLPARGAIRDFERISARQSN